MSRLAKLTIIGWMLGLLILLPTVVLAQTPPSTAQSTAAPAAPSATATPRATTNIGFAAASVTATTTVTAQPPSLLPTPTPAVNGVTITVEEDAPLVGTIFNNLSSYSARFFLEGNTYLIAPGSARGIQLPRQTSVLNLYNCDAEVAESATCFWDPYLVQSEGLYDIYEATAQAGASRLLLRESGAPPSDQVWVQNRTGHAESIVYRGEVIDLPATALHEFAVSSGSPAILYVRHCLSHNDQTVCEWTPRTLEAGAFYALIDNIVRGSTEGSTITTLELRPIVGGVVTESATSAPESPVPSTATANGQVSCRLEVPVLNVRSGPGLQYQIIDKVRSDGPTPTNVVVTGRSVDGQWLTVAASVTPDGWITSGAGFVTCNASLSDLPLVESPPLPDPGVVVTPVPAGAANLPTAPPATPPQPAVEATPNPVSDSEDEPTGPVPAAGPPAGLGLLQASNSFQHEIRITVDQRYRPDQGPSEFDLQPGEAINIGVFPGSIAFTVSSPWSGLSQNTTLVVEPDSIVYLWLRFERDAGGSWYLLWE